MFPLASTYCSQSSNKQDGRNSVRGQAYPGAKSGLQCCQGPLKAASTNLCPGWTSQNGLTTGSALVKVSGHCPFNMGAAFLWERALPAWEGSRWACSSACNACREVGTVDDQKREILPTVQPCRPQGFKSLVWSIISGDVHWTRSPGVYTTYSTMQYHQPAAGLGGIDAHGANMYGGLGGLGWQGGNTRFSCAHRRQGW